MRVRPWNIKCSNITVMYTKSPVEKLPQHVKGFFVFASSVRLRWQSSDHHAYARPRARCKVNPGCLSNILGRRTSLVFLRAAPDVWGWAEIGSLGYGQGIGRGKAGQGQWGPLGPGEQPHKAQQLTFVLAYARNLLSKDVLSMISFSGQIANMHPLLPFVKRRHPSFHSIHEVMFSYKHDIVFWDHYSLKHNISLWSDGSSWIMRSYQNFYLLYSFLHTADIGL